MNTPTHRTSRRARGFTLIELTIAVAVAGVLSATAVPGFEGHLQKARRSDVLASMMQIQSAQERFRGNSTGYGSLAEIGVPAVSLARHYRLDTTATGTDGYAAVAVATGLQARDATCRHMTLRAVGANLVYASGPDPAVANDASVNRRCWML